ncbi:MAG: type II toxin-antitoxin system HicA family toxin [Candidatus Schekmanbacteria bacterium]|nr:type II toxin-antitoxin system HicA family toxin [Candidatus Schekmanbacteria bacterium]
MSKLSPIKARVVIQKLERAGFVIARQTGSHVIMENEVTGKSCVVPNHGQRDIPRPTLRSIVVKQAGLTEDEFLNL